MTSTNSKNVGTCTGRRSSSSFFLNSDVIGREDDRKLVTQWLLEKEAAEQEGARSRQNVDVIALCGTKGVGKTTLAKCVFSERAVIQHFDRRMWIDVSGQHLDTDQAWLASKIIEEVRNGGESVSQYMGLNTLHRQISGLLKGQRFLLVLDGVSSEIDYENWWWEDDELRATLEGCCVSGSVVLVTSRDIAFSERMNARKHHSVGGLSGKHSWLLFLRSAVKHGESWIDFFAFFISIDLMEAVERIVIGCGGVPRELKAMGRKFFSMNRTVAEVERALKEM